jgi:hypothetical protein
VKILKIGRCDHCIYYKGSVYSRIYEETCHIPDTDEVLNGTCWHPLQIDGNNKPRPISPRYTEFNNNFPNWCELDDVEEKPLDRTTRTPEWLAAALNQREG